MDNFLNNLLRGLVDYRVGIFVVLILGFLVYIRKFLIALKEWQRSLVASTTGLALLLFLLVGEFLIATVVGPRMPSAMVNETPVFDPFGTATTTMMPVPSKGSESGVVRNRAATA